MGEYLGTYAYFLGCITPNRYPGIEAATKKIFKEFGVETKDMEGATCCPAPGAFGSLDLHTWLPIAARNIAIAEEMDLEIYVTCNGCYGSLQEADHLMKEHPKVKEEANRILGKIGREYKGTTKINHSIVLFHDLIGLDRIKERVKIPMDGINVAEHYGCHFLKPSDVRGQGSSETPHQIKDLVEAVGAKAVDYKDRLMCCGAGGGVRSYDAYTSIEWTRQKIVNAMNEGADCMVHPCAFCHLQLDRGQSDMAKALGVTNMLPIIFFSQFIGLAMGFSEKEVGLDIQKAKISDKIRDKFNSG